MKKVLALTVAALLVLLTACGDSSSSETKEPSFVEVATYIQYAVKDLTGEDVDISVRQEDWIFDHGELYYSTKTDMKIGGRTETVVCHIEFVDSKYEEYNIIWLVVGSDTVVDKR